MGPIFPVAGVVIATVSLLRSCGDSPFFHGLGGRDLAEIEETIKAPASRPKVLYPASLLAILSKAEPGALNFAWFEREWIRTHDKPCELKFLMPNWSYQNPTTGSVQKGWQPGPGSEIDPATGARKTLCPITAANWSFVVSIDEIRRKSGDGCGVDELTGYRFEPFDDDKPAGK